MNTCNFTGRISTDLSLKSTNAGKPVLNFNLACKRNKEVADFITIVLWGSSAEYIASYAKKGDLIGVYNGVLQSRKYEQRTIWEVHAFSAEILSHAEAKKEKDDRNTVRNENRLSTAFAEPVDEDELPF